jgi:hypothetical protein
VWQALDTKVTDDEPSGALTSYVVSMQGKNYLKKRIVAISLKKIESNRNKITQLFCTPPQASVIDSFASVTT